jgi:hypothetical protein
MAKLTKWFPADVKPKHPGVYERRNAFWRYAFWTGRVWSPGADNVEEAYEIADYDQSTYQDVPWRGLAHPPKGGV